MGALGQDDLGFGDRAFGPGPLPGGLHGAEDALGASAGQESGGLRRSVEEVGRPPAELGLDLAQGREGRGVEGVLVEEEPCGPFGHVADLVATVEHEAEGAPLGPSDVVVPLGVQFPDHLVDRGAGVRKRADRG